MCPLEFLYQKKQYFELENFHFYPYFHGVDQFQGSKMNITVFFWYKIFKVHILDPSLTFSCK
jgi:hypothetical protein